MEIFNPGYWNKESLTTIEKLDCGKSIKRIAGDEEQKDCTHFKRTVKVEGKDYVVDASFV